MKQYLEIIEQLTISEQLITPPEKIKIEVSSKAEAISLLPTYEPDFSGLTYIKRYHTCYHEEGNACVIELL